MMFDSHCHYNDNKLYGDYENLIKDAKSKGVSFFNVVGWDIASSKRAIEIANKVEGVFATVGIHPTDIEPIDDSELLRLKKLLKENKVIALGEIGLDYHWVKDEDKRNKQKEYFIKQINIANEYRLPIVVHVRDAYFDAYNILKDHRPLYGGIMHCYSGSKEMVKDFVSLGLHISLAGPVTFNNAKTPQEVAKVVPFEKLLIETDSPYLAPHPLRGTVNTSSNLKLIADKIAMLREISVDELIKQTTNNAKELFHVER